MLRKIGHPPGSQPRYLDYGPSLVSYGREGHCAARAPYRGWSERGHVYDALTTGDLREEDAAPTGGWGVEGDERHYELPKASGDVSAINGKAAKHAAPAWAAFWRAGCWRELQSADAAVNVDHCAVPLTCKGYGALLFGQPALPMQAGTWAKLRDDAAEVVAHRDRGDAYRWPGWGSSVAAPNAAALAHAESDRLRAWESRPTAAASGPDWRLETVPAYRTAALRLLAFMLVAKDVGFRGSLRGTGDRHIWRLVGLWMPRDPAAARRKLRDDWRARIAAATHDGKAGGVVSMLGRLTLDHAGEWVQRCDYCGRVEPRKHPGASARTGHVCCGRPTCKAARDREAQDRYRSDKRDEWLPRHRAEEARRRGGVAS